MVKILYIIKKHFRNEIDHCHKLATYIGISLLILSRVLINYQLSFKDGMEILLITKTKELNDIQL